MNVDGYTERQTESFQQATASADRIADAQSLIPGSFGLKEAGIAVGILAGVLSVGAARYFGVPTVDVGGQTVSTEMALTVYSAIAGIGGFFGTFIASSRLASLPSDAVSYGSLAVPVAITFLGNAVAGFLFPSQ